MNQKKVKIQKKNSKERTVVYLEIRSKTIVVISCNDTFKNENEKKRFRSVANTTTLGRALNKIDQTRPLTKKKFIC